MKQAKLQEMVKGWFVGPFSPTLLHTEACEVAVKRYAAGEHEAAHYHRQATEVTLIVSGRVRMAGQEWQENEIVLLEPGEITDFTALTDAVTVVVKTPAVLQDKFLV